MKKTLLALAALALASILLPAQEIRYNYRSGGITRVSTEYEFVTTGSGDQHPFWTRLEYVRFKDGSVSYMLYMNFEEKTAVNIPKGVRMAVTLTDGKLVRADQSYTQKGNKRAFTSGKGRVYWNRAQYLFEEQDMKRMTGGIKDLDVITGWNPEDYFQINYSDNQFGKVLAAHYNAISKALSASVQVVAEDIADYANNSTSITIKAKPNVATGGRFKYNVSVTYLYYKNTNTEDIDLEFQLGTTKDYRIHYSTAVVFELTDGEKIVLSQSREDVSRVMCYPSLVQVRRMLSKGVRSVTFTTDEGAVTDTFAGSSFTDALGKGYQTVMSVAER